MFNFKPPNTEVPGFRVNVDEDQPGFAMGKDGSVPGAVGIASSAPPSGSYYNALDATAPLPNFGPPQLAKDIQLSDSLRDRA